MSDVKRYIVFPPGLQPTPEEAEQLRGALFLIDHRIGKDLRDGGLAIECDANQFDSQRKQNFNFDVLLASLARKAVRTPLLLDGFEENPDMLQPREPERIPLPTRRTEEIVTVRGEGKRKDDAAKAKDIKEGVGRLRLKTHQTTENVETLRRIGGFVPYALIGLGAVGAIGTGIYAGNKLLNADIETRSDTIERVIDDPMKENLAPARKQEAEKPVEESHAGEEQKKRGKDSGKSRER